MTNPRLAATRYRSPQLRLFGLEDALGEGGWLKALDWESTPPAPDALPNPSSRRSFLTWKPCRHTNVPMTSHDSLVLS